MVYLGYNYEGTCISIVNAKSYELANAFWQGRNIIPHSIKCLEKDFIPLNEHPTGVFPLFETDTLDLVNPHLDRYNNKKYVVVKK